MWVEGVEDVWVEDVEDVEDVGGGCGGCGWRVWRMWVEGDLSARKECKRSLAPPDPARASSFRNYLSS